ncbi:MAG: alpha-amylase [Thermotogae bacterium]|nr:MAG: alpha-amylase [Thermotogota bacterium]
MRAEKLRKLVIYEVFPKNHTEEGTLEALTKDLGRIKSLGVDFIWLMPIYPIGEEGRKGSLGSPYAIKDYRAINPELGTFEDFKELVEKARRLGLGVMIDIVYNHTSRDSRLLKEHPEWFYTVEGKPSRKVPDWSDVYDLDYSNRELWDYQIETLKFWAKYVDGFRCDVAPLVPLEFWEKTKEEVSKVNPDLIWLAETVHPSFVKWLRERGFKAHSDVEMHQVFEITYDYDGREMLERYLRGERSLSSYIDYLYVQDTLYPEDYVKLRFLENHDLPRAAGIFRDELCLKNWTAFMFMLKGATLIYAGQEYAIEKQPNLFEKDPIPWEEGNKCFLAFIRRLIKIKKSLDCNGQKVYLAKDGIAVVECKNAVGIFNLEGKIGEVCIEVKGRDLLSGRKVESKAGKLEVSFEPMIISL